MFSLIAGKSFGKLKVLITSPLGVIVFVSASGQDNKAPSQTIDFDIFLSTDTFSFCL